MLTLTKIFKFCADKLDAKNCRQIKIDRGLGTVTIWEKWCCSQYSFGADGLVHRIFPDGQKLNIGRWDV